MNIKEVAKTAGVSVATISRVLNHPELVQPDTRNRILAVMEEANYQPNWFARGLNFGRTSSIALILPSIANPRYINLCSGVETVSLKKQHTVFLCDSYADPHVELDYLRMVVSRKVDGIIMVSSQLKKDDFISVMDPAIPWVHIGKDAPGPCDNICFVNYEEGTYQMTRHLIEMGKSDIQLVLDEKRLPEAEQIAAGYCRGLPDPSCKKIHYTKDSVYGGYLLAQKLLQNQELPSTLITSSNNMAFGIIKAAQDFKIEIPQRLALACLQDSPLCSIVSPALTSLELPFQRLGMVAARMLFDLIEEGGNELLGPQEIILQPKLKIRHSCGNVKHICELFD